MFHKVKLQKKTEILLKSVHKIQFYIIFDQKLLPDIKLKLSKKILIHPIFSELNLNFDPYPHLFLFHRPRFFIVLLVLCLFRIWMLR